MAKEYYLYVKGKAEQYHQKAKEKYTEQER